MRRQLFRANALAHQHQPLHGEVLVLPECSHITVALAIGVSVGAIIWWLVSSEYARKETVVGFLEPPAGIVKVFADNAQGKIKTLLVQEGQFVEKHQPLLIINGDRFLADGSSMESQMLEEYQRQYQLLLKAQSHADKIHQIKLTDLAQQRVAAEQDLASLRAQITTVALRQSLLQKQHSSYRQVAVEGHIAQSEWQRLRQQVLAVQSEQQGLQRDLVRQQNLVQKLSAQQAMLPAQHLAQQDELHRQMSDMTLRIQQLHGQRAHTLRASKAGYINNLQVSEGQQTESSRPLLSIVPDSDYIEARLLVPVSAIGFVKPNQQIDIRYDAFAYQKFGLYKGEITHVAEVVSLPSEISSSPAHASQPVYLVRVRLHQQNVEAYGQKLPLKAGMTLSADIRLGQRSLFEWLLEPLFSLKGRV